jgi:hypothetical protein
MKEMISPAGKAEPYRTVRRHSRGVIALGSMHKSMVRSGLGARLKTTAIIETPGHHESILPEFPMPTMILFKPIGVRS